MSIVGQMLPDVLNDW